MSDDKALAIEIVQALQSRGHIAMLVGGCVRDELLGLLPKDYDVVTSATPEQMEDWFAKTVAVGKSFGTLTVVRGNSQVQVSTLRNCTTVAGGAGMAPPGEQTLTLLMEDASDRDFTFNALFLDPITGNLIDFFEGQHDLSVKRIRTVGDPKERFVKDRLRMLRSIRFAACYGFSIAPDVMSAVCDLSSEIIQVSSERIRDELKKLLASNAPLTGLDLMMDSGLMAGVLPEIMPMSSDRGDQDPVWHPEGNVWVHSRLVVQELRGGSFELVFGGLLHDVGKPDTQERQPDGRISNRRHAEVGAGIAQKICARLKLSNDETERVCDMVSLHMRMHEVTDIRPGKLARLLERPDIRDLIALQHADAIGTTCDCRDDKSRRLFLEARLQEHETTQTENPFKALITGDTLISMGYKPGPSFREILEEAACVQREGGFADEEAAAEWLRNRYSN